MKLIEKNGRTFIQAKIFEIEYADGVSRRIIRATYHMGHDSNMGIRETLYMAGAAEWEIVDCLKWMARADTGDARRWDNGQYGLRIICVYGSDERLISDSEAAAYREEDQ